MVIRCNCCGCIVENPEEHMIDSEGKECICEECFDGMSEPAN